MSDKKKQSVAPQTLYAYWDDYSAFNVPEGIDLRDTKNVCWYVRWNTLHIKTKDGQKYEIEATDDPQMKTPEKCVLLADDDEENIDFNNQFDDSSDEEESEESEPEKPTEVITSYPTEKFNPDLAIWIEGDIFGMTLECAIKKLIICDDQLIFQKDEPAFIKKHGKRYERVDANLYNLMNIEALPEAPDSYWEWFRGAMKKGY